MNTLPSRTPFSPVTPVTPAAPRTARCASVDLSAPRGRLRRARLGRDFTRTPAATAGVPCRHCDTLQEALRWCESAMAQVRVTHDKHATPVDYDGALPSQVVHAPTPDDTSARHRDGMV